MKTDQQHIDYIRLKFAELQTKDDLVDLLNYVKKLIYGEKAFPFTVFQLNYYTLDKPKDYRFKVPATLKLADLGIRATPPKEPIDDSLKAIIAKGIRSRDHKYYSFDIKKKSGSLRRITAPKRGLKAIQKCLTYIFQCLYSPHPNAYGFVQGRSVVDNAEVHTGSRYVYNIDLEDFFHSIDQARVWKCLQLQPFNLTSKKVENVKLSEDADITKIILSENLAKGDSKENIWLFSYSNYLFREGTWAFKTPKGNNILYRVQRRSNERHKGMLYVYLAKTDISKITMIIGELIKRHNETDSIVRYLVQKTILNVIVNHQNDLLGKTKGNTLANVIAALCCHEIDLVESDEEGKSSHKKRRVLPQGAPTSPVLTNVVCQRLDFILTEVAKRFGLKYSRYADDITFSSMHNVYQENSDFIREVERVIEDQGFKINRKKVRLQKQGYRQEVTGLLVNERANVQKRYIKQLRMWLYYWERYGYNKASDIFKSSYLSDRGNVKSQEPIMKAVIKGKLDYLKMVKGSNDLVYLRLNERFENLDERSNFLDDVLSIWEREGIDAAMDMYYQKQVKHLH